MDPDSALPSTGSLQKTTACHMTVPRKDTHLVSARHIILCRESWNLPGLFSLKGICQRFLGLRSLVPGKMCV